MIRQCRALFCCPVSSLGNNLVLNELFNNTDSSRTDHYVVEVEGVVPTSIPTDPVVKLNVIVKPRVKPYELMSESSTLLAQKLETLDVGSVQPYAVKSDTEVNYDAITTTRRKFDNVLVPNSNPLANNDTRSNSFPNLQAEVTTTVSSSDSGKCNGPLLQSSSIRTTLPTTAENGSSSSATQEPVDETTPQLDGRYVHTLYHFLNKGSVKLCPYGQRCQEDFDEDFTHDLKIFLKGSHSHQQFAVDYQHYLEYHFKTHGLSDYFELTWKYCTATNKFDLMKYAENNILLYSKPRKEMVGKVCVDYIDYRQQEKIGHGGFGNVYKLSTKLGDVAVKEEHKQPLMFKNPKVFHRVMNLENDHVIPLLEYIIGGPNHYDPTKRLCLLVMPYMNRGGLDEHFKKPPEPDCIIKYMISFKDQEKCIFRNYKILFLHVFKGLQYLHSKGIVHGDVKDANILVHMNCTCKSPLFCTCPHGEGVRFVLGDMDLFFVQGESMSGKYVELAQAKHHEPAGTVGMKATELYFTGSQGKQCISGASDVWAGCVTMLKLLTGSYKINEASVEIAKYFSEISLHSSKHIENITKACEIASQIQEDVALFDFQHEKQENIGYYKKRALDVQHKFRQMKNLLKSGSILTQGHWIASCTYPERLPLPYIFGAVYMANNLRQHCLEKLPHIYSTPFWATMQRLSEIISGGLRFLPKYRLNASQVIEMLENLP
ncbi:uncharacterized protein [Dysidea avara]|uniref:uncharacterized protein n=1 Tax=Dysidea avara TaxID=196820 RepID=UPI003324A600